MIELIPLYSGSDGNAALVKTESVSLLIDCGGSCRSLECALRSVGADPDGIAAVFVTHEHSDHISAAEVWSKKHGTPIHITKQSYSALGANAAACAVVHPPVYSAAVGDVTVQSFVLPHDSDMCVGYRVTCGDESAGIATDMGKGDAAEDALVGCRAVMIECNHDENMLKNGPYPAELKMRILSAHGHLSNDGCARLAVSLASAGAEKIMLAHLSRENNTPGKAAKTVRDALDEAGLSSVAVEVCPSRCSLAVMNK